MLFQAKGQAIKTRDLYDQMKEIVTECLKQELTDHNPRHHLLFTANAKLQSLQEAQELHRRFMDVSTNTGRFHQQRYAKVSDMYHKLYRLIRGYMHLCDEGERKHFNHHFRLSSRVIECCYEQYEVRRSFCFSKQEEETFFEELKEEIIPLLCQIE